MGRVSDASAPREFLQQSGRTDGSAVPKFRYPKRNASLGGRCAGQLKIWYCVGCWLAQDLFRFSGRQVLATSHMEARFEIGTAPLQQVLDTATGQRVLNQCRGDSSCGCHHCQHLPGQTVRGPAARAAQQALPFAEQRFQNLTARRKAAMTS
jgi:hypothetical protein